MIVTAGTPAADLPVPAAVRRVAGAASLRPVWRNELGGLTFADDAGGRFVKWAPPGTPLDLAAEADRLQWAGRHAAVPKVLQFVAAPDGDVLLTARLAGRSAVDPYWLARPREAVRALGRGLRRLHDSLPISACPFSWSAAERVADARRRHGEDAIGAPPSVDRLVVCQGDPCAPNTLLHDNADLAGHVDLGRLGVADRWADLAVATWSTEWNYGAGWDGELLAGYGVVPDQLRTAYYRRLWELGP